MMSKITLPTDGQFTMPSVIPCDPKIRGTAICHLDGKCSICPIAKAYLNPDIPLHVFKQAGGK